MGRANGRRASEGGGALLLVPAVGLQEGVGDPGPDHLQGGVEVVRRHLLHRDVLLQGQESGLLHHRRDLEHMVTHVNNTLIKR